MSNFKPTEVAKINFVSECGTYKADITLTLDTKTNQTNIECFLDPHPQPGSKVNFAQALALKYIQSLTGGK